MSTAFLVRIFFQNRFSIVHEPALKKNRRHETKQAVVTPPVLVQHSENCRGLFDSYAFRQITRLVNITATPYSDIVGEQLQR